MNYVMMHTAKETKLIPLEYQDLFPDTCVYCKSELEITDTLTELRCPNPRCPIKIAQSMVDFLAYFGVKGYGIEYCKNLCRGGKYKSIIDLVKDPPIDLQCAIAEIRKIPMTYAKVASLIGLPGIKERAKDLFIGINNYDQLYNEIIEEGGGIAGYIQNRLGGDGTIAFKLQDSFIAFSEELENIEKYFNIEKQCNRRIRIAITGNILRVHGEHGESFTKSNYVNYLNQIAKAKDIEIELTNAVASSLVIIADTDTPTTKYCEGKARNKLVTSDRFLQLIKEVK